MAAPTTAAEIRSVNTRYHDHAAAGYDAKWGIDYAPDARDQVVSKLRKALGRDPGRLGETLEIGAGTGYFTLNLMAAGLIADATCTDISPGMLAVLETNAERLDLTVRTRACDAESLPFDDRSFDTVLGHAVLHHLPDLGQALRELHRVLRPGGLLIFAGEPSRGGDRLAAGPKRAAMAVAPIWRAAIRASPATAPERCDNADHHLERHVDIHAFTVPMLVEPARAAGFEQVRVAGEELLANLFGWFNRTLESTAEPATVPMPWRRYAYRGYLALQRVDAGLLEPRLPAGAFYNLLLSARRPHSP